MTLKAPVDDWEVDDRLPLHPAVKTFVFTFVGVFTLCGVAGFEVWPLSGWHLFSRLRTERQTGWLVSTLDVEGFERPVPFADLPPAYRGWYHVAAGLLSRSPAERQGVCQAWAAAVNRRGGPPVVEVRIYATDASLRNPQFPRRHLRYSCPSGTQP
jgi:hypothetical protein